MEFPLQKKRTILHLILSSISCELTLHNDATHSHSSPLATGSAPHGLTSGVAGQLTSVPACLALCQLRHCPAEEAGRHSARHDGVPTRAVAGCTVTLHERMEGCGTCHSTLADTKSSDGSTAMEDPQIRGKGTSVV